MARGPRGPRKRNLPKPRTKFVEAQAYEDDDTDLRDTPEYRRRQWIIRLGTSFLLFCFIATSFVSCIASNAAPPPDPQQQVAAGNVLPGQARQAEMARLREAIKKDPKDASSATSLGIYLLEMSIDLPPEQGRKTRAESRALFEKIVKDNPLDSLSYTFLGDGFLAEGDLTKARDNYNQALEIASKPIDPKLPNRDAEQSQRDNTKVRAQIGLAGTYRASKNYDKALSELDNALKLNPGYAQGYLLRARIQMDRKQPEQARRDLGLALECAKILPDQEKIIVLRNYQDAMQLLDPSPSPRPQTPSATPSPVASSPTPLAAPLLPATSVNSTP